MTEVTEVTGARKRIPPNPRPIPEPDSSYRTEEDLYGLLKVYLETFIELPDKKYYDIVASWAMATWHVDLFRAVPYLYAVGPPASGKSTLLEVLQEVCYKAFRVGAGITAPALVDLMHNERPTLLIDETENLGNEETTDIHRIINSGQRDGAPLVKMVRQGKDWVRKEFNAFGFKAMASIGYPRETVATRSIIIQMGKKTRELSGKTLTDQAFGGGHRLRAWLHAYQLQRIPLGIPPVLESKLDQSIHGGRVVEIGLPLLTAAPEEAHEVLWAYLKELDRRETDSEQTGWESDYVRVLLDLNKSVENGKLSLKSIRDKMMVVLETDDRSTPSARTISQKLRGLGFQLARLTGGSKAITYDVRTLQRLKERFLPDSSFTSVTSFTDQHSGSPVGT